MMDALGEQMIRDWEQANNLPFPRGLITLCEMLFGGGDDDAVEQ